MGGIGKTIIRLLRLGIPISIGRLGVVGMGVVDTIAVGQLAPRELAHQALGWMINGPALLGGVGMLLGVQVLAARAMGAGRPERAAAAWRRGLIVAAVAGIAYCALYELSGRWLLDLTGIDAALAARAAAVGRVLALSIPLHLLFMASAKFLEALERPIPAATAMWLANGVNLALNLAFVPAYGALGSAWATVASRLFLALVLAGFVVFAPSMRRFRLAAPGPDERYGALMWIGAAAGISAVVEAGAFAAMTVIAARHGGAVAVATWAIATGSLVTLVYLLAQGLSTAGVVLVSEAIGRGAEREADRIGWAAIALTLAAMAACAAGAAAFAVPVAAAFTADPAVQGALVAAMGLIGLLMISDGGQGPADAVLRARGVNWLPTAVRIGAFAVAAPLLGIWLSRVIPAPAQGVLTATAIAGFAVLAAMTLRLAGAPLRREEA